MTLLQPGSGLAGYAVKTKPLHRHVNPFIHSGQLDARIAELIGDFRQIPSPHRPADSPRLKKSHTETFTHTGGYQDPGLSEQSGKVYTRTGGQLKLEGQVQAGGKPLPCLVAGPLFRIKRPHGSGKTVVR